MAYATPRDPTSPTEFTVNDWTSATNLTVTYRCQYGGVCWVPDRLVSLLFSNGWLLVDEDDERLGEKK
jgi:hypothetical protein